MSRRLAHQHAPTPASDREREADAYETLNPLSPASTTSSEPTGATRRANGAPTTHHPPSAPALPNLDPQYLPSGPRSLSGISLRSFILGCTFTLCASLSLQLALFSSSSSSSKVWNEIWRGPFFLATLSLFHYLEFHLTARFNPRDATTDSFLLSANGSAYNAAHALALLEWGGRIAWRSDPVQARLPDLLVWLSLPVSLPGVALPLLGRYSTLLGMVLIVLGQTLRSAAMATAGKSFNHLVQSRKREDHVLVTTGVYAISRHPSYAGFFWWGLGTQMVLGNTGCLVVYAVVLWGFFRARIRNEEVFLGRFFEGYREYRGRTWVGIPFIR